MSTSSQAVSPPARSNVLIIGGSGFLSGAVARAALAQGRAVWTVTRGQRPAVPGATSLIADRNDAPAFAQAIADAGVTWDLVVDCIAYTAAHMEQDLALLPGRGMAAEQRTPPLKRFFMDEARGMSGDLPDLLKA